MHPEADIHQAGQVLDKAIEYLAGRNVSETAIAAALLGAAVQMLMRGMDDAGVAGVLGRAIDDVRAGEPRRQRYEPSGSP